MSQIHNGFFFLINSTYISFRTIVEQSKWVAVYSLDAGSSTPFNRLKRNWLALYPASTSDTTKRVNSWSPEGDTLTLVTPDGEPMKIHLEQMQPAVFSLFEELETALTKLLPCGMVFPPKVPWESCDNIGAKEAFVEQPDFLKAISPLYTKFAEMMMSPDEQTHKIWSGNKFQSASFWKWQQLEQTALEKIFLIILFTGGGVSPRTFSISGLQYRGATTVRNLYIHGGTLCFAWPKAKGNSRSGSSSVSHSLFSYPHQLSWPVFVYLGMIRKFSIQVIGEQKWSLGELERSLFVYCGKNNNRGSPWGASHMNSILGTFSKSTFGSAFSVSDFRQITQAVYHHHFQGRSDMDGVMEEAANRMANHTKLVADRYYTKTDITSTGDPQLFSQLVDLCMACSRAWHYWLGLTLFDPVIKKLGSLPILQRQHNWDAAQLQTENWLLKNQHKIPQPTDFRNLLVRSFSPVKFTSYFWSWVLTTSSTRGQMNTSYSV